MYNFIHKSLKQMNIHISKSMKSKSKTILINQTAMNKFKLFSNKLSIIYRDVGEKCIEKGWYYR